MTPLDLARGFVAKGLEDEATLRELLDNPVVSDPIRGFHAQQAAEKYLKAVLAIDQERPERTHDLERLASQCAGAGHAVPGELEGIFALSEFAVQERYPLATLPPLDRAQALGLVSRLREWVEGILAGGV